jgi:hypothetical protein
MDDTVVCVVNSHLSAGMDLARRKYDISEIQKRSIFTTPLREKNWFYGRQRTIAEWEKVKDSIWESDYLVWMGDLNFRIEGEDSYVRNLISNITASEPYDFSSLLVDDQLLKYKKDLFPHFSEGVIQFKPTYKLDIGTSVYDTSEKRRVPAWCDRVLYHCPHEETTCRMQLLEYQSHPETRFSDHTPVSALFELSIRHIPEFTNEMVEYERLVDAWENESLPKLEIQSLVDFGEMRIGIVYHRTIRIQNIGLVKAHVNIEKLEGVLVHPLHWNLQPGEEGSVTVSIAVSQEETIDKVLVFTYLERQSFVTIHGTVMPSLVHTPTGISIPQWLYYLCDFLIKYGVLNSEGVPEPHHNRYLSIVKEYVRWGLDMNSFDATVITEIDQVRHLSYIENDWKVEMGKVDWNRSCTPIQNLESLTRGVYETLLLFLHELCPLQLSDVDLQLEDLQERGKVVIYVFGFLRSITEGWKPPLPRRDGGGAVVSRPKIIEEVANALFGVQRPAFTELPTMERGGKDAGPQWYLRRDKFIETMMS